MANAEQEDLSQLKGPMKVWQVFGQWCAIVIALAIGISFILAGVKSIQNSQEHVVAIVIMCIGMLALYGAAEGLREWYQRNHRGHKVWWWEGENGKWRVTAKGYPTQAPGLVIEVHVRAKPGFRLMWGPKGWWCAKRQFIIGDGYRGFLSNQNGELIAFTTWNNIPAGLTKEVVELLCNPHSWRIVPHNAGLALQFVDGFGVGLEIGCTESDADIEGILKSISCSHYRVDQRCRMEGLRESLNHEKTRREETWQWMCQVLNHLRAQASQLGRPRTKIMVLEVIGWILEKLHEKLPEDHQLRRDYGVSAEEWDRVCGALAVEREKRSKGEKGAKAAPAPEGGNG